MKLFLLIVAVLAKYERIYLNEDFTPVPKDELSEEAMMKRRETPQYKEFLLRHFFHLVSQFGR